MYCEGYHGANRYIFGGILREGRWSASAAAKVFIVWHAMCYASCRPSLKTRSRPSAAAAVVMCDVMEPTPRPDLPGCRGWLLLGEYSSNTALCRDQGCLKRDHQILTSCPLSSWYNCQHDPIWDIWGTDTECWLCSEQTLVSTPVLE